ncbi:glycosyltransferase [Frankia sp. CiP3]|uniref:glycosyltransferase family 2 protein n=1 Tax=Frankia sp. CiP3 TaxID=2880971 RepID=UPI001EF5940F|nr:glycosyltransferase [Frankia sp. CiP3]
MTLRDDLQARDNDYDPIIRAYESRIGKAWQEPAPHAATARSLSVVIPAHNVSHAIKRLLDALQRSAVTGPVEVIVVDDASTDGTAHIARGHPLRPTVLSLPERLGSGAARNIGTLIAGGDLVLYLDGDMVIPPYVLQEHTTRGDEGWITLGFRHNLGVDDPRIPTLDTASPAVPDLEEDHRVRWRARAGRYPHTGLVLDASMEGRPLDHTDDLRQLGYGTRYYDWDLPRMVVTAMMSVPRVAVLDVGGFHPGFGTTWGAEDTYLGAALIAAGLKVAPVRTTVGFHLDPPDAIDQWKRKAATWQRNIDLYWRLLDQPTPHGLMHQFQRTWTPVARVAIRS